MGLNKLKLDNNNFLTVANGAVLVALFGQLVNPGIAEAKAGGFLAYNSAKRLAFVASTDSVGLDNQLVIQPSVEDRIFTKLTANKPNKAIKAIITAYSSTPGQTDESPFFSASGKHVYDGMVAANWLPFGTKLKIPSLYGDKIFTVDDRMNKRFGYGRLDLWLDATPAEAAKFGVKRVEVEIFYQ